MIKHSFLFAILAVTLINCTSQLNDSVECFRMKDSSFGHFATCTATKPLPLKVQTTITLDKDFTWGLFAYDVALYDGVQKKTTSVSKCIQGSPGVGNKTAGSNLTLATTCNVLPRELRQFDMIRYEIHFPNSEWLVWAVPIPGYTTNQDVRRVMEEDTEFNKKTLIVEESQKVNDESSLKAKEFIKKIKLMKNIRPNF